MLNALKCFSTLLLMFGMVQLAQSAPLQTQIIFAVVPQQTATDMATVWGPVLQYIGKKTGYSIRFQASRDMQTFEQRLNEGEFDIAYINPYQYISARKKIYDVFAKEKDKKLKGIVVVLANSPYKSLEELNNVTMAFPGPTAFAATLLPMAYMAQKNLSITPAYVLSHESVYLAVAKGLYPAGGGVEKTFESMPIDIRQKLRILWTSEGFTPHAIAAHSRVPKEVVDKIAAVLFEMDKDAKGRELLDALNFKGITPAKDDDYQDVRAISSALVPKL